MSSYSFFLLASIKSKTKQMENTKITDNSQRGIFALTIFYTKPTTVHINFNNHIYITYFVFFRTPPDCPSLR